MLVLSRKVNQTLVIGPDIEVTILSVNGKTVSLGITAPKAIRIDRKEIVSGQKDKAGLTQRDLPFHD